MEPLSLGWRPLVKSWMAILPKSLTELHKKLLNDMFERFVDPCLACARKKVKELSPTTDSNLVNSLMNLIDCQLDEFQDETAIQNMEEREVCAWLECIFVFSLTWSIGGSCTQQGRDLFNHLIRELFAVS